MLRSALLSLSFALAAPAPAQVVAAEFTPNPVAPGQPSTLTAVDSTGQGRVLPSPCGWFTIHQGAQTGPVIDLGVFCPAVLVPIAPHGSFSFTWDQRDGGGALVAPGMYWFEVRTYDATLTTAATDWYCVSIQPAASPALTAAAPARLGQATPLQIAAPQQPNDIYLAVISFSSNNPITAPGFETCIDLPIFLDFLAAPLGALDGGGNSQGLQLVLPNAPIGLWHAIHVQAVLFTANALLLTNSLPLVIRP